MCSMNPPCPSYGTGSQVIESHRWYRLPSGQTILSSILNPQILLFQRPVSTFLSDYISTSFFARVFSMHVYVKLYPRAGTTREMIFGTDQGFRRHIHEGLRNRKFAWGYPASKSQAMHPSPPNHHGLVCNHPSQTKFSKILRKCRLRN